ncbi:MAG: hypothetical protein A3I05_00760 [Deltaproteobacteria bacterium RIFCSPLOWO2_02_FULL_44_10]|nr:MAG: hypothetical protein A3C46_06620 [Deltaproteobacteria bacterium RIFCSPHIGHO2_02_FULL_44_16]OGQ46496.1 MAG: hypothetical protein A3I05_00760 [Deltaproteobacteria bacterium RIFCSPLOWO2_02_FULL_44_10]
MPTKHPRLHVLLPKNLLQMLSEIARNEDKSLSVVAQELIADALDRHEDRLLSGLAMKRESKAKRTVSHDKAWK